MFKFSMKALSTLIISSALLFSPISQANTDTPKESPSVEKKVENMDSNTEMSKDGKKNKNKKDKRKHKKNKNKENNTAIVNINTATEAELKTLYGVGKATAKEIVAARTKEKFKSVDDLKKVKGMGPKTIDKIKARLAF